MVRRMLIGVYFFPLLLVTSLSIASWSGPQVVVTGSWGNGAGQFYWDGGNDIDSFPQKFGVDKNGLIVIPDSYNKRIVIYNPDGTIMTTVTKPVGLPDLDSSWGWPTHFYLFTGGNSFIVDCNYQKMSGGLVPLNICFLNYKGTIESQLDIKGINDETTPIDSGYIVVKKPQYFLYSAAGKLLQTYTSAPSELGIIDKITPQTGGNYSVIIRYPERTFSVTVPDQRPEKIVRDSSGYLYTIQRFVDILNANTTDKRTIQHYRVIRYSYCSKEVARLDLPQDVEEIIGTDKTVGNIWQVDAGYGQPIIAPNGDIYTWKQTPTAYSILKWTWVDDPNVLTGPDAPTGLSLMPSTTGLYLTWTASVQDPGCVTGYEVSRAISAGGTGTTVATLNAGVVKYNDATATVGTMYYYKIRAVAGNEYSPYTAEVSAKRP